MKTFTFKITFITLNGNKNQVIIDALNEQRAELEFDANYQYQEIIRIEEIEEN